MEQAAPAWDAMSAIARLADTMASQQEELRNLVNTLSNNPSKERRVEGMAMPTFAGKKGESLDLFLDRVLMYLEAKNIDYHAAHNQQRVVAMVASHLKEPAASWYYASKTALTTMDALAEGLRREFVPVDLQERLRSDLQQLRHRKCSDLDDYIAQFRQLLSQIRGMGDLDQVTWFIQGLVQKTREEVIYRRCQTVSAAMAISQQYERSHPSNYPDRSEGSTRGAYRGRSHDRAPRSRFQTIDSRPEPMEIGNVQVTREECRRKRLCFFCKQAGHTMSRCPKRNNISENRRIYAAQVSPSEQHTLQIADGNEDVPTTKVIHFNMAQVGGGGSSTNKTSRQGELIRKDAVINGKSVRVLIDSGADTNMIRPGFLQEPLVERKVNIEGFDGSKLSNVTVREGSCSMTIDQQTLLDILFTEFELPGTHDAILGKPWLTKFNPRIDWVTHEIDLKTSPATSCLETHNLSAAYRQEPLNFHDYPPLPDLTTPKQHLVRSPVGFEAIPDVQHAFYVKVKPFQIKSTWPRYVQSILHEFRDVIPERLPTGLPPQRAVEFEINLKPNAMPQTRPLFRLSKTEQDAIDLFVASMAEKEWIELSNSPWVSNVFGVPKKNPVTGKAPSKSEWIKAGDPAQPIRWVVDYRFLNSQTLVPRIPIPHIDELFDRMSGAVFFSTLDLAQGYHQMRVKPPSRPYTAFRTRNETYQWCVAPMGCSGMPGIWSRLMRSLFDRFDFVVVYLDDICVFSRTATEHEQHLRQVFEVLREQQLYVRLTKCEFGQVTINFLGHTISENGLAVDSKKTEAVAQWSAPQNVKELQSFLGLAGYYRRFVRDFAKIVMPLSNFVKSDVIWSWGEEQDAAFASIKTALQKAPVLRLPDFEVPFRITTDASGYCCGGVLSQVVNDEDHPVAFYSKKLSKGEINWPPHEKERFAILLALKKWRHYVYGSQFKVFTDNSACRWFLSHPRVSGRLARWLDYFGQFNFELEHVRGEQNVVADALSRPRTDPPSTYVKVNMVMISLCEPRDEMYPYGAELSPEEDEYRSSIMVHAVALDTSTVVLSTEAKIELAAAYANDPVYNTLGNGQSAERDFGFIEKRDGLVFLSEQNAERRLCVPASDILRTKILAECHDGPSTAHPGQDRTFSRAAQWYFWPELRKDVKEYVASCLTCQRYKTSSKKRNGLLIPLEIPSECWEVVGLDYVTGLPNSHGYDCIQTAICLLSKRAKYAPTVKTADGTQAARVFFDSVVRHHGLPRAIVSDRDSKFTGELWSELMRLLGVQLRMTVAHRAQADGQTERQNRVLADSLRCITAFHGKDWATHLGTIELAHATLRNKATGFCPFEIDTGRRLRHAVNIFRVDPVELAKSPAEFAVQFIENRRKVVEKARSHLLEAQHRAKANFDRGRSNVQFKIGDLVFLRTDNIPLRHLTLDKSSEKQKLAPRKIGPFKVLAMINENAARLELPASMKRLHPVFNVDSLEHFPVPVSRFERRPTPKNFPVVLDDEEYHVVEALLKKRQFNRQREWLIKWQDLPEDESTWLRERDVKHVTHWRKLLADFKDRQRVRQL